MQIGTSFIPATAVKATIPLACHRLSQCNVFYIAGVSTFAIDTLCFAAAQQAAAANPEINMVDASGDQVALGVEKAATELNRTVRIVGVGALDAVCQGHEFCAFNSLPKRTGRAGTAPIGTAIMNAHRWFPNTPYRHRSRRLHLPTVRLDQSDPRSIPLVRRPVELTPPPKM